MRLRSVRTIDPVKTAVRVATVGNVALTPLPSVIDGVSLVTGDRVLVKEQTTSTENGLYDYPSGRSRDANELGDGALGQVVFAAEGDVNAGQAFVVASLVPTRFDPVVHRRTLYDSTADASPPAADGELYPMYTYTLPAGQLCRNGDRIEARWVGTYATGGSSRQLIVKLAGDSVFDSSPITVGEGNWRVEATIVRVDNNTARVSVLGGVGSTTLNAAAPQYHVVTAGLDLSTAEDLVLEGSVSEGLGHAGGDLTGRFATISWAAAAPG